MMKVIPLGTSSGKPTLRRNVSAVAIAREGEWLLFDCGEGTQTQIARVGLHASRLTAIFITHLHGDHFNGVSGLLSTMGLDRRERLLTMIGPRGINEYLNTLARLKILYVNYPLDLHEYGQHDLAAAAKNSSARFGGPRYGEDGGAGEKRGPAGRQPAAAVDIVSKSELAVVYETSDYEVRARPLDHRIFAIGYRVEERPRPGRFNVERARELGVPAGPLFGRLQSGHNVELPDGRTIHPWEVLGPPRPGKAVAYCTDTRPCLAAVELARDVDLLIHEATYTQELADEARAYGHSTASDAARIAAEAGVRRLLITHFSSRYHDAAPLLEEARSIFPDTILASDLEEIEV